MEAYRLSERKARRLFLKTANGILILCALLVEPVLAQVGNPGLASGGRPDLSGIPAKEAKEIENACDYVRRVQGPGEYYQCLQSKLATLQKFLGPPKRFAANEPKREPLQRPTEKTGAQKGKEENEKEILDQFEKLVQEQNNAEQKKLAPAKPEQKQRGKSVDPKTTTEKYETSPKEELGQEPSADIASPKLPQANQPAEPTKTSETLFPRIAGLIILFFIARWIYSHIPRKRCIHCNTRTKNVNKICDECKTRMDYEKAKAQERETQEREARIRAEENRKRQEEARAQERRKQDEENARARERERRANEARRKAEENRRREEERAQEERRRRQSARSNNYEPDPYEVLQVTRGASKEEIKAAYFNMIKRYHPDKVSHLGKEFQDIAEKKAQEINRAYETLMSG